MIMALAFLAVGITARSSYMQPEDCMTMPFSDSEAGGGVGATVQSAVGGRSVQ